LGSKRVETNHRGVLGNRHNIANSLPIHGHVR
jgi:hypothetical protein